MKNIFLIFARDIRKIATNYVALVVALGLIFLPSLYAWFNIEASWDPYGNTKGIKVAVSNNDVGVSVEDETLNIGETVVDNLRKNNDIGWQFVGEDQAVNGVKSGKYYASIIIPEDFSKSISSILTGKIEKPTLQYYVNEKKNAIAPKITDKGVSSFQQTINQTFVKETSKAVFKILNLTDEEFQKKGIDPVADIINMMDETRTSLSNFATAINGFEATAASISDLVDATALLLPDGELLNNSGIATVKGLEDIISQGKNANSQMLGLAGDVISAQRKQIMSTNDQLEKLLPTIDENGANFIKLIQNMQDANDSATEVNRNIINTMIALEANAEALNLPTKQIKKLKDNLGNVNDRLVVVNQNLNDAVTMLKSGSKLSKQMIDDINNNLSEIDNLLIQVDSSYKNEIKPAIDSTVNQTFAGLNNVTSLLNSTNKTLPKIGGALNKTSSSLSNGVRALQSTNVLIQSGIDKADKIITDLESVEKDERFSKLVEIIREDPKIAGDFMSAPVLVETNQIYPIINYGSAMAPFYSILAIWVGALILAAILKCRVDEDEKINNLKPFEVYFGRYLIFMILGILQSIIINVGNLYILKIQCLHPEKFIFAGIFAAIVFTLIIYTLTISFGDVGKAIAVIFMVIQVAAAGGTFPIEVTPSFFKAVNPFLPFTFGINAMRECIAGIYENAYDIDLVKLSLFIPISLLIGLILRKPIITLKEFFERKLEDTGVM